MLVKRKADNHVDCPLYILEPYGYIKPENKRSPEIILKIFRKRVVLIVSKILLTDNSLIIGNKYLKSMGGSAYFQS